MLNITILGEEGGIKENTSKFISMNYQGLKHYEHHGTIVATGGGGGGRERGN